MRKPPSAADAATRTSRRVRFPGGSGHELAAIVDSAGPPEGSPVILFSHCFTCSKDLKAIVRISRRLAELGFTLLRYDMTGLGQSHGDFAQTNFTTNLADLQAAAAFAAQQFGPPRFLIGHSFGGAASLAAAAARDSHDLLQELRGVITLAAPADTQHLATLLDRLNPAIEATGQGDVTIGGLTWTITRQMLTDFRRHRLSDLIPQIDLPLLLFHSPEDQTVGFDEALRIMHLASAEPPAATVNLITLSGADHLLSNQPSDLTYVAELIATFARRHL